MFAMFYNPFAALLFLYSWHSHFKRIDTHLCVLSEGRRALPVDCMHPFHADEIRPNRLNHRHVRVLWCCIISRSHGFGESAKCIDGFVRLRPVTHERARVLLSVGDGNGIAELISNAPPADRGPTGHKWGDTFIAWWTQRTKKGMLILSVRMACNRQQFILSIIIY